MTAPGLPDPLTDAVAKALAAAAAATDAAHEAEGVLAARGHVAAALEKNARRTAFAAALALGTSVVVLALAAFLSLRSAAALRAAVEAQEAAGLVLVEQIGAFKANVNALSDAADALASTGNAESKLAATMAEGFAANGAAFGKALAEAGPVIAGAAARETGRRIDALEVTVIEALADIQLSVSRRGTPQPPAPGDAPPEPEASPETAALAAIQQASARLMGLIDEVSAIARPVRGPEAQAPGSRRERPAQPGAPRPQPNPFQYP